MGCQCIMQNIYNKSENFEIIHAGFAPRFAAYVIDLLVVGICMLTIKIPVFITSLFITNNILEQAILFEYSVIDITTYICGVAYFILLTYYTGTTLGKKLMNLRVVSTKSEKLTWIQVIYRETVGRFLSGVIYGVGYILIALDRNKRGFHDILSDTNVVYGKRIKVVRLAPQGKPQERTMPPVSTKITSLEFNEEDVKIEKVQENEIHEKSNLVEKEEERNED